MAGTVRRIIERIKEQRSGGNSVVALTAETRLVLQGFDPERFDFDTPDDPGRLARIRDIADEMGVDVADLIEEAAVAPDAAAAPAPAPETEGEGGAHAAAQAVAAAAGLEAAVAARPAAGPMPPSTHPLQRFKLFADEALAEIEAGAPGSQTGAPFPVLIKASLLMALYSVATDRVFCDQLHYNNLYQWFLDLPPATEYAADAFGADRQEALGRDAARRFFDELVPRAGRERLFSSELLQANGRQIKSWMSAGVTE